MFTLSLTNTRNLFDVGVMDALPTLPLNASLCNQLKRKTPRLIAGHQAWTHLQMKLQMWGADHLYSVEPLSVQAFTNAVARAERGALVLDIGSNAGAYSIYAAVLGASVIAVDMQPKCAHLTACHLSINGLAGKVQLAYVASSEGHHPPIRVHDDECHPMSSPSAVAGRWPYGQVMKKTRILMGVEKRATELAKFKWPGMVSVPALHIGDLLASASSRRPIAATKIE